MARPFLNAAEVVGAPTAPPIAGARSLLFPPREFSSRTSARFTARLAVAPADRVLRATVRMVVGDRTWRRASTVIRVAIPGGQQSTAMLPEAVDPLTCDGQGMAARCYAAAVPLEIPLPALGAREVLVDVNRQSTCGLPPPPEPGFLLDDLRVE
jgi:hypothetical protein